MSKVRIVAIITAALGVIDSIYLLIIKISNNKALCIQGVGDCWSVNTSIYSEISGIPVSVLGIIAFSTMVVLWVLQGKNPFFTQISPIANFFISLVGLIFSAYLTYLEIAVIKAICPFCVLSAILIVILFSISLVQIIKNPGE